MRAGRKKTKLLVSVHSQKGGVGKTILALYLARRLAQKGDEWPGLKTVLIDADLTGTSLAEGIPLVAPRQKTVFHTLGETRNLIRDPSTHDPTLTLSPDPTERQDRYLNDILLSNPVIYRKILWGEDDDCANRSFLWCVNPDTFKEHR